MLKIIRECRKNSVDVNHMKLLKLSCEVNNIKVLKCLFHLCDGYERGDIISLIIKYNRIQMLRHLLLTNLDDNILDIFFLLEVCKLGNFKIVKIILNNGVEIPRFSTKMSGKIVDCCIKFKHYKLLKYLQYKNIYVIEEQKSKIP